MSHIRETGQWEHKKNRQNFTLFIKTSIINGDIGFTETRTVKFYRKSLKNKSLFVLFSFDLNLNYKL